MNSGCTACLGLSGQSVTCRFVIYGGRAPQTFHTLPRTLVSANCASACGGDDTHFLCCIEVLLDGAEEVAEAVNCVKGTSIQRKRLCKPVAREAAFNTILEGPVRNSERLQSRHTRDRYRQKRVCTTVRASRDCR